MIPNKARLRLEWLKQRKSISSSRRIEAAEALANTPFPRGVIASFVSFRDEINTEPLNQLLAQKKQLALPRIENGLLAFYRVDSLENQLTSSLLGMLQPIPSCPFVHSIDVILVPGLAFDKEHYRLGYGKGHYDRYLNLHPTFSIGIGFKEQLTDVLPHEAHDVPLQELYLF